MSSCINDRRQWKSFSALSQFSFLFSNHFFFADVGNLKYPSGFIWSKQRHLLVYVFFLLM